METQALFNIAFIILGFAALMLVTWLLVQNRELINMAREGMQAARDLAPEFVVKELADMARGGVKVADERAKEYVTFTATKLDDELYAEMRKEVMRLFNELKEETTLPAQGMDNAIFGEPKSE